ncbi:MAG: tetratricopeptide repeat protein [Lentimicrobiaceae bacterium]|nr:tetratricopeptide repeat protein [Lentimicrobiaceae bacterium]
MNNKMIKRITIVLFVVISVVLSFCSCNKKKSNKAESSVASSIIQNPSVKSYGYLSEIEKDSIRESINTLNKKGNVYRNQSHLKLAFEYHKNAYEQAKSIMDTGLTIISLNNLGTDLRRSHAYTEAAEYHFEAVSLASHNPKYKKSKAISLNSLGNIFLSLNKFEDAFAFFEEAMAIERELNSDLGLAINYANIGEIYHKSGDYENALYNYQKSLKLNESIKSNLGVSLCLSAIGNILIEQKRVNEGIDLLKKADEINKDSKDLFHKLSIKIDLGFALVNNGRYEEAYYVMDEINDEIYNSTSYELKKRSYTFQSKLYNKTGKHELAYLAKEKASIYDDSLKRINNDIEILERQNQYQLSEASYKIKLLTAQNELALKNNLIQRRTFILSGIIVAGFISFLIYMIITRQRKNNELLEIQRIKTRLLNNISHEFRTPLTLIHSPIENLIKSEEDPDKLNMMKLIYNNSNKLLALVEQMLTLAKAEAGKYSLKVSQVDLSANLNLICESFSIIADSKSINYKVNIDDSGIVYADLGVVEIIVLNLLSNAFKHSAPNANVSFYGKKMNNNYLIRVSNTYKTMTQNEINLLFNRFFSNKNVGESGFGIGLSLVKELCDLYRMSIKAYMNEDNELEFAFSLPIGKNHFKQNEFSIEIGEQKLSSSINRHLYDETDFTHHKNNNKHEITILLVEDNDELRYYLTSILSNRFNIIEAIDGQMGYDKAVSNIPDLIISDIMMPNVDGYGLCKMLKDNEITKNIPIIILTAVKIDEDAELRTLIEEFDIVHEYVTKPFNPDTLIEKIQEVMGE